MKKLPQDLSSIIHQADEIPGLAEKAELLANLNHYVKQAVSGPVADQLRVANLRQDVLVIETSSAAWASRINFQKPKLLRQLQAETLPMLTAIEVKINPRLAIAARPTTVNQSKISSQSAEHIEALADQVEGTLGEKLKRLAALASRNRQNR
ncbi:DUF721 domain-containing protein [Shewanella sp. WXL01]|uniref:DUF721 domain-containing protein n=1 Tax=Shewanella maritima TaxID=2520507 RepID=A0A411PII2_9GAMM|nr:MULTISPECIES: DciA family protein [Shewanella]NKF52370.1 DUF721 domain-containing protein [Shewanella sp. WXL01]QBF83353.1 DUF721 domain-containing protein [Shewanella maritima]